MKPSKFIVIPQKAGGMECEKHRAISIMSQVSKIVLCVMRNRVNPIIHRCVDGKLYGFRKGKGTANTIFALRIILERSIEMQNTLYMCFVDFEKAFDTVRHEDMMTILKETGLDGKDLRLLTNLYWDQQARVDIGGHKTNWVEIRRGARQGCVISPDFFSLYGQKCMEDLEELEGIRVGGQNINNLRYADDTVLVADTKDKLQALVNALGEACSSRGLKINFNKTEVMAVAKGDEDVIARIYTQGKVIKQVKDFKYLGSIITTKANCEKEIKTRIAIAKTNFGKMKKILTNLSIDISLRIRLLKCYIWSTLTYGCEGWTLRKNLRDKLEAAEMWFLRRMLRIPWTARVTNETVLRRARTQRTLLKTITRRQLGFLGHTLRSESIEKTCLLGRIQGRRARGRQRTKLMDTILQQLGNGWRTVDLVRLADDREGWRSMVADVTRLAPR